MQTAMRVQSSSPSMGMARAPRSTRLACRCQLSSSRSTSAKQQHSSPSSSAAIEQASLALAASMLPLAATLPAFADEAETGARAAAIAAGERTEIIFGMSSTELAVAFSPLVVYGLFSLYREKINPRAKLGDVIFIVAALFIFGNIFSILVFKKRFY